MTTQSFKQMTKDGVIKRADKSLVRYDDIHVEEGFNIRDMNDPEFRANIDSLKEHLKRGGKVPPLEVVPYRGGGVKIIDGHCRYKAFGELRDEGHPIEWIAVEQFPGNDAQQVARLLTSNEGLKLKPTEIAEGYRRLHAMGMEPEEIGRYVGKTRQHVDQMLILASAPLVVQKAVKAGELSATTAIDVTRKHGDQSSDWLKEAKGKAKEAGKKKITAATTKAWTPPTKVVAPILTSAKAIMSCVKPSQFQELLSIEERGELDGSGIEVMVNASDLLALLRSLNDLREAAEKAADKARGKAGKAAQMEVPGVDGA